MRVVRASHLGMCFGVRGAIAKVLRTGAREPLTVLGELVHNESVLEQLAARGIRLRHEVAEVDTPTVAITAHGASDRRRAAVHERGLRILDATCPIVRAAHRAVTALAHDGFHPVIVGTPNHVEVRGLTEDLDEFDVISTPGDVERLSPRARFGVAAQTTQPIERLWQVASLIQRRFPQSEVRVAETVCVPTRLRQEAAEALAAACDVVVVVGGAHSNNTRELCATCRRHCGRVCLVQDAGDLRPEWFEGARVAGLTAGTSTPDAVIDEVEAAMRDIAQRRVA
ncbi:MAG: 4-hydroxy-3-methylbut-2-enyl diphosphate reductase [Acidobacteria bacterium]|nr:MAG: 4-hydroxy-3-methylbut-2-enyl diphosphate reductase [Acidobacteriota bacterium]